MSFSNLCVNIYLLGTDLLCPNSKLEPCLSDRKSINTVGASETRLVLSCDHRWILGAWRDNPNKIDGFKINHCYHTVKGFCYSLRLINIGIYEWYLSHLLLLASFDH